MLFERPNAITQNMGTAASQAFQAAQTMSNTANSLGQASQLLIPVMQALAEQGQTLTLAIDDLGSTGRTFRGSAEKLITSTQQVTTVTDQSTAGALQMLQLLAQAASRLDIVSREFVQTIDHVQALENSASGTRNRTSNQYSQELLLALHAWSSETRPAIDKLTQAAMALERSADGRHSLIGGLFR